MIPSRRAFDIKCLLVGTVPWSTAGAQGTQGGAIPGELQRHAAGRNRPGLRRVSKHDAHAIATRIHGIEGTLCTISPRAPVWLDL